MDKITAMEAILGRPLTQQELKDERLRGIKKENAEPEVKERTNPKSPPEVHLQREGKRIANEIYDQVIYAFSEAYQAKFTNEEWDEVYRDTELYSMLTLREGVVGFSVAWGDDHYKDAWFFPLDKEIDWLDFDDPYSAKIADALEEMAAEIRLQSAKIKNLE